MYGDCLEKFSEGRIPTEEVQGAILSEEKVSRKEISVGNFPGECPEGDCPGECPEGGLSGEMSGGGIVRRNVRRGNCPGKCPEKGLSGGISGGGLSGGMSRGGDCPGGMSREKLVRRHIHTDSF